MEIANEKLGIKAIINESRQREYPEFLNEEYTKRAREFHSSIQGYKETPLIQLEDLAKEIGVSKIYVKDESFRFGLNSFKCLGGTYAIASLLCEVLNIDIEDIDFEYFKKKEIKERIMNITFITATDGNHGRGVAWAATQLGCKSIVYLPKGAAMERVNAIKKEGAKVHITDLNYDDAVRLASKEARDKGCYLIQDTVLEDYEKIPNWIVQGYTTMADEALEQLDIEGVTKPTHMFLQAGVGSMAGGVLGYFVNKFKNKYPKTIIVEPENAACIFKSVSIDDGKPHYVKGDLNTIMAGLACGEPNPNTWNILRDFACCYISCPDYVAARGSRILGNPIGKDKKIISGESGSVGLGLLTLLMEKPELNVLKDALELNEESIVLLFSTEGDTDPENYKSIIYDGKFPSFFV